MNTMTKNTIYTLSDGEVEIELAVISGEPRGTLTLTQGTEPRLSFDFDRTTASLLTKALSDLSGLVSGSEEKDKKK